MLLAALFAVRPTFAAPFLPVQYVRYASSPLDPPLDAGPERARICLPGPGYQFPSQPQWTLWRRSGTEPGALAAADVFDASTGCWDGAWAPGEAREPRLGDRADGWSEASPWRDRGRIPVIPSGGGAFDIVPTADGGAWLATPDGVRHVDGSDTWRVAGPLAEVMVDRIAAGGDDLWATADEPSARLYRVREGRAAPATASASDAWPTWDFESLLLTTDAIGRAWWASETRPPAVLGGAAPDTARRKRPRVCPADEDESWGFREGTGSYDVRTWLQLAVDSTGTWWLPGLGCYGRGGTVGGRISERWGRVVRGPGGRVWGQNWRGIRVMTARDLSPRGRRGFSPLPEQGISLVGGDDEALWAGGGWRGTPRWGKLDWERVCPDVDPRAWLAVPAPDGRIWWADSTGVVVCDPGSRESRRIPGSVDRVPAAAFEDGNATLTSGGRLWLRETRGPLRMADLATGELHVFPRIVGVGALTEGPVGTVWAWDLGRALWRIDPGSGATRGFGRPPGVYRVRRLLSDGTSVSVEDDDHRLWRLDPDAGTWAASADISAFEKLWTAELRSTPTLDGGDRLWFASRSQAGMQGYELWIERTGKQRGTWRYADLAIRPRPLAADEDLVAPSRAVGAFVVGGHLRGDEAAPPAVDADVVGSAWALLRADGTVQAGEGDESRWTAHPPGSVEAIARGPDRVCVGGVGLWCRSSDDWQAIPGAWDVRALDVAADGSLWVADRLRGACRVGSDATHCWEVGPHGAMDVATAPQAAWVGGTDGLWRIDASGATRVNAGPEEVRSLAVSPDGGDVWAVRWPTGIGHYRIADGGWHAAPEPTVALRQNEPSRVEAIAVDRSGHVWARAGERLWDWVGGDGE